MSCLLLLKLTDIIPDPNQPRKDFDPNKLREPATTSRLAGARRR